MVQLVAVGEAEAKMKTLPSEARGVDGARDGDEATFKIAAVVVVAPEGSNSLPLVATSHAPRTETRIKTARSRLFLQYLHRPQFLSSSSKINPPAAR